jgi:hypothetical protein
LYKMLMIRGTGSFFCFFCCELPFFFLFFGHVEAAKIFFL